VSYNFNSTVNIILDNQNLTLTESTNFLGTHLYTNLSWTLHGKIIDETEYSMQFDEEFYYYLIPVSLKHFILHIFSHCWNLK